jgi:hypothetical protein
MMKAGTETGSLVNHLYSRTIPSDEPVIGMAATILGWTDRHPGTVVEIKRTAKTATIFVQADHAKRVDDNGMSEAQEYVYSRNPNGPIYTFRRQPNGSWREKGKGSCCILGRREMYYDFSF